MKRQKRQKRSKRHFEVHGGYTDSEEDGRLDDPHPWLPPPAVLVIKPHVKLSLTRLTVT